MDEQPQWDIESIRGPQKVKAEKRDKLVVAFAGIKTEITKTGLCAVCGEKIVFSPQHAMWFHVGFVKGQKHYSHQGRER